MKQLLLLLLFFLMLSHSFAQKLSWGVHGGISISNMDFDGDEPYDNTYGLQAGVDGRMALNQKFFLQASLGYSHQGYKIPFELTYPGTMHLHYMALPVVMGYAPVTIFSLAIGVQPAYLVSYQFKPLTNYNFFKYYYRKMDWSLTGQLCFNLSKRIALQADYDYGISKIARWQFLDANGESGYNNIESTRVVKLGVRYQITKPCCKKSVPWF